MPALHATAMVGIAFYVVLGLVAALASALLSPVSGGWEPYLWGRGANRVVRRQTAASFRRTGGLARWAPLRWLWSSLSCGGQPPRVEGMGRSAMIR